MPFFVYVLQSLKDNNHYIGSTSDLEARIAYHNSGRQRSTKSRIPFKLMYSERHPDKQSALKREKEIKSYKGGIQFKKLLEEV